MLELLVALLIFSIGMLGLLSGQLVGKRAVHDALQRSVAIALARDILERVHANPTQVHLYRIGEVGAAGHRLPEPPVDCDSTECNVAELASFDLWQWESRLLGGSAERAGTSGLLSPRACITGDDGVIEVVISWRGMTPAGVRQGLPCVMEEADDIGHMQHLLSVVTRVAGSP